MTPLRLNARVRFRLLKLLPFLALAGNVTGAEYVIAISIDALRPAAIRKLGPEQLPNLYRFRTEGVWTDQARTDFDWTWTNPNHTTMVTGRPVEGANGHHYTSNGFPDPAATYHSTRGHYVSSMFDVAHDHGLRTSFYSAKAKLRIIEQSYTEQTGAEDLIGEDNGRDKIDHFEVTTTSVSDVLIGLFVEHMRTNPYHLSLIHIIDPDTAGHGDRWETSSYLEAVQRADAYLGQIFSLVEEAPFVGKTTVLLTTDHGGYGSVHEDPTHPENYTIPFYAWGADVPVPGDLYQANVGTRVFPGTGRPTYEEPGQPVRNGDLGNLALSLLGLPPIPDEEAIINQEQDLRLTDPRLLPRLSKLRIKKDDEGVLLEWDSAGSQFHYQLETNATLDSASWEPVAGMEPTPALDWKVADINGSRYYRVRLIPSQNQ